MISENKTRKAYVLTSGGLDSTLAVKFLQDQGIEVTGVYISTGFCINSHQKKTGRFDESKPDVFKVCEELGIELEVIDISKEYIPIITNPKYGWGKNVNPCIDCRIHMLQKTRELMLGNGFDFIATGEVLGQRPMSQRMHTAKLIEEKSGLKGFLVRPLSAQLHPQTEPEKRGWLDRKKLGRIQGRSRKDQMRIAQSYGLKNVAAPAGGCCFLTDETYAVRFKDFIRDRKDLLDTDDSQPIQMNSLMIMATGRQVKIRKGLRLILGRNESENRLLGHYADNYIILEPDPATPGPTAVIEIIANKKKCDTTGDLESVWDSKYLSTFTEEDNKVCENFIRKTGGPYRENLSARELLLCASILSRYIDRSSDAAFKVIARFQQRNAENLPYLELQCKPFKNEETLNRRLIMKANESIFLG